MAKKKVTSGKVPYSIAARTEADAVLSREPRERNQLLEAVQRLRSDFDEFVQQTSKGVGTPRQEIKRLARRLRQLEQLVRPSTDALACPPSTSKSLFTFLGRSNLTSLS